jgi:RsiW-degrading membrane proteinase PrsW (M82 family)
VTINVVAALLPVLVFLAILVLMDSFKLVPPRAVLAALAAGGIAALSALDLHAWLLPPGTVSFRVLTRYMAPLTEETLKAAYVVFVLRRRRLGFLVDAAIVGFAVGTGFALVENADYLSRSGTGGASLTVGAGLGLWLVRGFGPALLHGTTTALFAMLAKSLTDRHEDRWAMPLVPAWMVAVGTHSLFNHFPLPPILSTCVLVVVLPLTITFVFERSERATREWVGEGLDLDVELLNLVTSGEFGGTRLGAYLRQLRSRFPGPVVADMFCLLRVELELAIRAKGMLMAREAGLDVPVGPDVQARLREADYLRASIGTTGLLALKPLRVSTGRDDWHRYLLRHARRAERRGIDRS